MSKKGKAVQNFYVRLVLMKVFISWSGKRSRMVAEALKSWLPLMIQSLEPWISSEDIDAGARWGKEIDEQLEQTNFGIICVTKENQKAPWIHFEAGAIAKAVSDANVCPYLIGLQKSELEAGPLTRFQVTLANKEESLKLIKSINNYLARNREKPLAEENLYTLYEKLWPNLEDALNAVPDTAGESNQKRSQESIIEEVLEKVRGIDRKLDSLKRPVSKSFPPFLPVDSEALSWHKVKTEASAQLKAFLNPAVDEIDFDAQVITLFYGDRLKFHFNEMKKRVVELHNLVTKISDFPFDIVIVGPGDALKITWLGEIVNLNDSDDDLPY